jgi:hypothetical protein
MILLIGFKIVFWLVVVGLPVYIIYLLIKALRIYIKKNS